MQTDGYFQLFYQISMAENMSGDLTMVGGNVNVKSTALTDACIT